MELEWSDPKFKTRATKRNRQRQKNQVSNINFSILFKYQFIFVKTMYLRAFLPAWICQWRHSRYRCLLHCSPRSVKTRCPSTGGSCGDVGTGLLRSQRRLTRDDPVHDIFALSLVCFFFLHDTIMMSFTFLVYSLARRLAHCLICCDVADRLTHGRWLAVWVWTRFCYIHPCLQKS